MEGTWEGQEKQGVGTDEGRAGRVSLLLSLREGDQPCTVKTTPQRGGSRSDQGNILQASPRFPSPVRSYFGGQTN